MYDNNWLLSNIRKHIKFDVFQKSTQLTFHLIRRLAILFVTQSEEFYISHFLYSGPKSLQKYKFDFSQLLRDCYSMSLVAFREISAFVGRDL